MQLALILVPSPRFMPHAYFLGQNDKLAEVATTPPEYPPSYSSLDLESVSIPAIETQLMFSSSANEKK
jgi:hypothetical protein